MTSVKKPICITIVCIFMFLTILANVSPGKESTTRAGMVTIVPRESNELLANPGMGWETFHHTRDNDRNLPDWIPSTIHYARWGWGVLEPQPGKIDYAFLDKTLKETHQAGQRLAFRVMCCSTTPGRPYHPAWLQKVGGRIIICDYSGRQGLAVPDLDDPVVLQRHLDFIKRLGAMYDGHPDLDHVDLGSVGWWGEWHMSSSKIGKMPTMKTRTKIIDAYLAAFRKTPLLMLIGGKEALSYAARHGTGWRADCLGDMGGFSRTWCHMRNAYLQMIDKAGITEQWRTAPVAWETCWDMRKWVKDKWPLRYIFNYALALHGSYLNNKSAPLPPGNEVRNEIERFLRRLGYRLVLKELKHPQLAHRGGPLPLAMKWQNVGSAPCYRPYRLAYRLTNEKGYNLILVGTITVEKWMPGSLDIPMKQFIANPPELPPGNTIEVNDRVALPADMPTGTFTLSIGVVGPNCTKPVVKLAITGRNPEGWYPLSKLRILK